MFMLITTEDILPVSPKLFQLDLETVVKVLINKKYANHVIQNVGLAISLYDLISLDDSYIYQGEGDAYTRVRFRLIVFSPFLGEVYYIIVIIIINFLFCCCCSSSSFCVFLLLLLLLFFLLLLSSAAYV